MARRKVAVLACSGIGKPYGTLSREVAHELTEKVRPDATVLTCLALLLVDDPEAKKLVTDNPVIAIDGCPKECARKAVEALGQQVEVPCQAMKFYVARKDLKPEGLTQLNEAGMELSRIAAQELADTVDRLAEGEGA